MYKLCKTEQSAKRQRDIENCLLELLSTRRYEDITITEICQKMNMPRKSFYRYFDGKEGVMQSLIQHTMMDYNAVSNVMSSKPNMTIKNEFEIFFDFWKNRRDLLSAFDRSGLLGHLIESSVNFAMMGYDDMQRYLSDSYDEDKRVAYQFTISGLMTMMINWYRNGFAESVESMSRATTKIITKPLFENLSRTE